MGMKYLAGDFPEGTSTSVMFGQPMLSIAKGTTATGLRVWQPETLLLKDHTKRVEVMTEENKKRLLGKAAWGVVGFTVLGPLGAIAGLFLAGNKREICFVCHLKDDRSFMATADSKTYQKLLASSFSNK
jgi:hypothetical protein